MLVKWSELTFNTWDRTPITGQTTTNLFDLPNEIAIRQSLNLFSKGWTTPKKREGDGKWKVLTPKQVLKFVTTKDGMALSIYRIHNYLDRLYDVHKRKLWTVSTISKERKPYKDKEVGITITYTVMQFTAKRNKLDISGA